MDVDNRNTCRGSIFLFLALISHIILIHGGVDGKISSPAELEIKKYLRNINKPAVKTIKSPSGELIDCVDINNQPALDHPLLVNHTIQIEPSLNPSNTAKKESSTKIHQAWHENGKCPEGTIPIRRATKADLLRAASPESFGKKYPLYYLPQGKAAPATIFQGHEHSYVLQLGDRYYGANADINLWNPEVNPNDFSLSQIWIISDESIQNTAEVGIMVNPVLYGDYVTRLFIYWTADDYKSTGCYNLLCSGFVQTSNQIALGTTFASMSSYGGDQYQINIYILKDKTTGHWWLSVGGYWVGYWPNSLLPALQSGAQVVEWGGEVYNANYLQGSTTTQMGSGHFAEEGFKKAAYFNNLLTADADGNFHYPTSLKAVSEKPNCYDVLAADSSFYYGGPGKSDACP